MTSLKIEMFFDGLDRFRIEEAVAYGLTQLTIPQIVDALFEACSDEELDRVATEMRATLDDYAKSGEAA